MHRTQIYLDEYLVQEIKKVAKMQNITMSAFINNDRETTSLRRWI